MGHPLDSHIRRFEAPFQLWSDLRCRGLRPHHPVTDAIIEVKDAEERRRKGIIPLRDCRTEAPLG